MRPSPADASGADERVAVVRAVLARAVTVVAAGALVGWGLTAPAVADPASPTPTPAATPAVTAAATPDPVPTGASPSAPTTGSPSDRPLTPADAGPTALTLTVGSTGGPVADAFYADLGSFAFAGTADLPDGSSVQVQRSTGTDTWENAVSATVVGGAYAVLIPVEAAGPVTFRADTESTDGTEGSTVTSEPVTVTVQDSTVALSVPTTVDALKDAPVTGTVVPARAAVVVAVEVRRGSSWVAAGTATTGSDGTFATVLAYGTSNLRAYDVRATFHAVNRDRDESSATQRFTRVAVLDPQVDDTTGADVAKTYRKGCPVGPSKLSTIHLNYYGRDKRMHRGVIIVRTDLRQEIIRGFDSALKHRYPIAKMNNPNTYGGNDPRQMKANNTSGFNCRKVVGNPYAMSPHSYGIAIDVNTVQNPYRDGHGKWWPSNGKKYRDRTPLRWGMLGKNSWLTKSLRKDHFFWGGRWNPGRDYQHFEYRG